MTHADTGNKKKSADGQVIPPPDGGWGWMVTFGSFMIHVIADGITYTVGIFLVEFMIDFNVGSEATSWIASILVAVTLGSGPIVSSLVNKYGCRTITIVGALISAFGLGISVFATNVYMLYITIGLVTGFGFGLMYLPAIVSVSCYFETKRSFATGIAVCGSGVGTFLFAPLCEWLIDSYHWTGALLILSAIGLNCVIFGALFRAIEAPKEQVGDAVEMIEKEKLMVISEEEQSSINSPTRHNVPETEDNEAKNDHNDSASSNANGNLLTVGSDSRMARSQPHLLHVPASPNTSDYRRFGSHGNLPKRNSSHEANDEDSEVRNRRSNSDLGSGVMLKKDIFYSGSLVNIPQYKSNPKSFAGSAVRVAEESSQSECAAMMDLSLFKDPIFLLFSLSNFCTSIGFNVPYVFMKDKALDLGISSPDASFLIAVIGIANTIGRIILGYISDKPWLNRLYLYNAALTIAGIATALSAFCTTYTTLVIYAAVFGASIGAYVGLTSVVLVDLLGLDKLTNAFGLVLMFQGIASLAGPPIAGRLRDTTNSYDPAFYVAGTMIAISGLMLYFIPLIQRCMGQSKVHDSAKEVAMLENGD